MKTASSPSEPGTAAPRELSVSPTGAILMGLLVPGLPQLRAGEALRGGVAFASVVGLFFLGYTMLGERYHFCEIFGGPLTMQGVVGTVLRPIWPVVSLFVGVWPETFALGPTIAVEVMHGAETPPMERMQRLPVEGEAFGFLLTSAAGLVAMLFAADAAWIAAGRRTACGVRPAFAAGLGWLLPGAGHLTASDPGTRGKGVVAGAAVWILFLAGLALAHGQAVDRGNLSVWWIGESFAGVPWALGAALSPMVLDDLPWGYDLGVVLCTTAGLCNIILMIDAYTIAEQGPLPVSSDAGTVAPDSGGKVASEA